MIQANASQQVDNWTLFPHISEFAELEEKAARRRQLHFRQKFVVHENSPPSCGSLSGNPFRYANQEAAKTRPQAKNDLPNTADELFREAAEKVDNKIVMDKRIYGGAPCVANTRVPVYAILELVEAGYSHKKILKSFPTIGKEGLAAALQFAVLVMER